MNGKKAKLLRRIVFRDQESNPTFEVKKVKRVVTEKNGKKAVQNKFQRMYEEGAPQKFYRDLKKAYTRGEAKLKRVK